MLRRRESHEFGKHGVLEPATHRTADLHAPRATPREGGIRHRSYRLAERRDDAHRTQQRSRHGAGCKVGETIEWRRPIKDGTDARARRSQHERRADTSGSHLIVAAQADGARKPAKTSHQSMQHDDHHVLAHAVMRRYRSLYS